jgi:hypothetical protein
MRNIGVIVYGAAALAACSSSSALSPDGGAGKGGAAGVAGAGIGGGAGTDGGAGTGSPDAAAGGKTYEFHEAINRNVDILVMVDNSLSMKPLQQKLTASFPILTNALQALPGGLPNLHLAVISSTMGSGPYGADQIPSCPMGGDRGTFQAMPTGTTCATGNLNPGASFIIANGQGTNNFTGTLSDTFACIAALGDGGCGFEHQFASVLRALGADGAPAPVQNVNFLRRDAYLFVVLLTNEDDCSAPPESTLFDPSSRFVSDPRGPLASYRCNAFGHLCGGQPPPLTPPAMETDLGTCTSAEDGALLKVSDVTARLKALKPDPSKVFVTAIAGPPTPYKVNAAAASLKDDPAGSWPVVTHSCTAADGTFGDPGVRIAKLVDDFGSNGYFQTICNDSFGDALTSIGAQVGRAVGGQTPCLEPGTTPSQCTFVDHTISAAGTRADTPLPSCLANGNKAPCWSSETSAVCGGGPLIHFNRAPGAPAVESTTTATCAP